MIDKIFQRVLVNSLPLHIQTMSDEIALGIYVSHYVDNDPLIRLIAKEHTVSLTSEGPLIKIKLHDDISCENDQREFEVLDLTLRTLTLL